MLRRKEYKTENKEMSRRKEEKKEKIGNVAEKGI